MARSRDRLGVEDHQSAANPSRSRPRSRIRAGAATADVILRIASSGGSRAPRARSAQDAGKCTVGAGVSQDLG